MSELHQKALPQTKQNSSLRPLSESSGMPMLPACPGFHIDMHISIQTLQGNLWHIIRLWLRKTVYQTIYNINSLCMMNIPLHTIWFIILIMYICKCESPSPQVILIENILFVRIPIMPWTFTLSPLLFLPFCNGRIDGKCCCCQESPMYSQKYLSESCRLQGGSHRQVHTINNDTLFQLNVWASDIKLNIYFLVKPLYTW